MTKQIIALAAVIAIAGCATQRQPQPSVPGSNNGSSNGRTSPVQPRGQTPSSSQMPSRPSQGGQPNAGPNAGASKPPPRNASQISSPAVMSLLNSADQLARAGHMSQAAATLERALNLEPRNPFIYQRLAAVRMAQGQIGQAEQLARKSNSLAGNNPFILAGNWRLIAAARRDDGNASGARKARARAVNFEKAGDRYGQ